jgi:hypothetical protein
VPCWRLAALQRAGHLAVVRDHDGLPAHRRHRRHGHDLRRGDRLRHLSDRAKLSAGFAAAGSEAAVSLPWLSALLSPDRWLLWLGLLFVLSVYYFPTGVGRLRAAAARKP